MLPKLVEKEIAETHSSRERCFGLATSHDDLCQLRDSTKEPEDDLAKWILFLFCDKQVEFVERKLKACDYIHPIQRMVEQS
jgi:hypothetical protein